MDPSKNFSRRPRNFRQSNTDLPREHHEHVPLTSPTANQPRLPPRNDSNFLIAPFKMEKIKKNLDVVFELRKLESEWQNCLKCNLLTKKKCGGCNEAPYCCEECQHEDWNRHFQECGSSMEIQNISLQNTESLQTHQGGRNNFSRQQQNFGNQLDLSYIGCGDVRRNQNTENEAINRVPNGYHRDNEFPQRFNKNQSKHPTEGNFSRDSNRNEASQSNSGTYGTKEDGWGDNKPKRDKINQDVKKEVSPAKSNKSFDQRRQDDTRKGPRGNNRRFENKNDPSNKDEWGKPRNSEPIKTNESNKPRNIEPATMSERDNHKPKNFELNTESNEVRNESIDKASSSCKPKNLGGQEKASEASFNKKNEARKLEKPEIKTVVGISSCDESSYYVLTTSDWPTLLTLHSSLQEDAERLKCVEPKIGTICACLTEAEWYRGKIVSINPDVEFVALDFGPTWKCDEVEAPTKELPEELVKGPGMARLVKFTEKLPKEEFDGEHMLIEVLETFEDHDLGRYIGEGTAEIVPETAADPVPETAPEAAPKTAIASPTRADTSDVQLEDSIASGSLVTIATSIGVNICYVQRSDFADEKLAEIGEKLIKYSKTGKTFSNEDSIKIGDIVCALFLDDNCFYRALVQDKRGNKFDVQFVDYGNLQGDTELKHLMPLPDELKSYPRLAVKVNLKGVSSSVDVKSARKAFDEIGDYLNNLSLNSIKLKLTYDDDILKGVTLTENDTGKVVNEEINEKLNHK